MYKKTLFIGFIFLLISLISCTSIPATMKKPSATESGPRTILLGHLDIEENDNVGPFTSWYAVDFVDEGPILLEVGYFSNTDITGMGYVLYDGGYEGTLASYQRQGLDHRWDWGPDFEYAFVIQPDGTGLYYDFTGTDGSTEASGVYKCYKWQ